MTSNQVSTDQLPSLRHPEWMMAVQKTGIASAPRDYTPDPSLDEGPIKGFPWGERTLHVGGDKTQYMVYTQNGREVLSCMPTPELAAQVAIERLEREAIPPEHYSSRLAGMRFGRRADDKSPILVHTVVDAEGNVVGESQNGRAHAARDAIRMVCRSEGVADLTFEEFSDAVIAVPLYKAPSKGGSVALFCEEEQRGRLMAELGRMWQLNPSLQVDSDQKAEVGDKVLLKPYADRRKFILNSQRPLLELVEQAKSDVLEIGLPLAPGVVVPIYFHDNRISSDQVVRAAYRAYLEEQEAAVPQVDVPRA